MCCVQTANSPDTHSFVRLSHVINTHFLFAKWNLEFELKTVSAHSNAANHKHHKRITIIYIKELVQLI